MVLWPERAANKQPQVYARGCTEHHQEEIPGGMGRVGENRWRELGKDVLSSVCKVRLEGLRRFYQTGQRLQPWEKSGIPVRENSVSKGTNFPNTTGQYQSRTIFFFHSLWQKEENTGNTGGLSYFIFISSLSSEIIAFLYFGVNM